jgi:hypothetical protein
MRPRIFLACLLIGVAAPAIAQLSVSIGINLRSYPDFVEVPGYPVYYAPEVDGNVFFYDGLYWVYADDQWYSSFWFDGPWDSVASYAVPLFILRVPVRYYRRPPAYFRGWRIDAPPRWGEHWGSRWQQQRSGWDQWNRSSIPERAPLPVYQRNYSGDRYPRAEQQRALQQQNYRYQPRDPVVRERWQQQPQQQMRQPQQPRPLQQDVRPQQPRPPQQDVRPQQPRPPQQDVRPQQPHQPQQDRYPQRDRQTQQPQQQKRPQQRERPPQHDAAPPAQRPAPDARQPERTRDTPQQPRGKGKGNGKGNDKQDEPKHD